MAQFDYKRPADIAVTTTETTIEYHVVELLKDLNLYMINKSSDEIFFEILGSASGVKDGGKNEKGAALSAAVIVREWVDITIDSVEGDNKKVILIPRRFNVIKIKAWTISGTSTLNYFVQSGGQR